MQPFYFRFPFWASGRWCFWFSKTCTRQLWEIVTIYRSYTAFLISIPFLGKCSLVFLNLQDLYQAVMRNFDHRSYAVLLFSIPFLGKCSLVFLNLQDLYQAVMRNFDQIYNLCSLFSFHSIFGHVFVGVSESPRLVPGSYEKLWPSIGPLQPF